jgi:UDP-glucose 4-epimerase
VRLLVLGGAGYIGSVVAAELVAGGHAVTVADDGSRGRARVPGTEIVEASLLDPVGLDAVCARGFDAALHFAALSIVPESVREPELYFRTNVLGTLNLLEAMHAHGIHRIVFSSTASTYGEPESVPIDEDAPTRPTNPYGASKLAVDHLLAGWADAHDAGAVSLRYFNVAGAAHGLGEHHDPETHLIPIILEVAAGEREAVSVYGTDYPTPDGTAIRDYIHIADLAAAHVLALDATATPGHRIYNLGNGEGFSVREVIDAAERVTGRRITTVDAPRRDGDPVRLVASSERIRRELGWRPAHTDVERMIADAWAHRHG